MASKNFPSRAERRKQVNSFRSWKSGHTWLYSATTLVVLTGGMVVTNGIINTVSGETVVYAATTDATSYVATAISAAAVASSAYVEVSSANSTAEINFPDSGYYVYSPMDAAGLADTAKATASADAVVASINASFASSYAEDGEVNELNNAAGLTIAASLDAYDASNQADLTIHFASAATSVVSSVVKGLPVVSSDYTTSASVAASQASIANDITSSAQVVVKSAFNAVDNTTSAYSGIMEALNLVNDAFVQTSVADLGRALSAAENASVAQASRDMSAAYDYYLSASMYAYDASVQASMASYYATVAIALLTGSSLSSAVSSNSSAMSLSSATPSSSSTNSSSSIPSSSSSVNSSSSIPISFSVVSSSSASATPSSSSVVSSSSSAAPSASSVVSSSSSAAPSASSELSQPTVSLLSETASSDNGVYAFDSSIQGVVISDFTKDEGGVKPTVQVVDSFDDSREPIENGVYNLVAGTYTVTYSYPNTPSVTQTVTVKPATTTIETANIDLTNSSLGQNYNSDTIQANLASLVQQYLENNYPSLAVEIAFGHLNPLGVLLGDSSVSVLSSNVNENKVGTYQVVYGVNNVSIVFTVGDPQAAWIFKIDNLTLTQQVQVTDLTSSPIPKNLDSTSVANDKVSGASFTSSATKKVSTTSSVLPDTGDSDNLSSDFYLCLSALALAGGAVYRQKRKSKVIVKHLEK